MKLAVTYENGEVFQHFGRTPYFEVFEIEDGKILNKEILDCLGSGHGELVGVLTRANVDALLCGGMGMGAQNMLAQMGIKVFAGISGNCEDAVNAFLNGTLSYTEEATCDHHHEDGEGCSHHEEGEGCGCHSQRS